MTGGHEIYVINETRMSSSLMSDKLLPQCHNNNKELKISSEAMDFFSDLNADFLPTLNLLPSAYSKSEKISSVMCVCCPL